MVCVGLCGPPPALAAESTHTSPSTPAEAPTLPSIISLETGQIRSVSVQDVTRVAIGNPDVLDVSVVSASELLLQAKAAGTTNLLIWDAQGQRGSDVWVIDRTPEATEEQLRRLLHDLELPNVQVRREEDKLFLIGQVTRVEEIDRLEQLVSQYPSVTNLVKPPEGPPPETEKPLVVLTVQVIEMAQDEMERLGVEWSNQLAFTEPAVTDENVHDLLRVGTSMSRGSLAATLSALVERKRARILAEPKLVTASGIEAKSFIGFEVPVIRNASTRDSGGVNISVERRETGVVLTMTPSVQTDDPERRIKVNLTAEVSAVNEAIGLSLPVGDQTVLIPGFSVRKTNTEVTTTSGDTIVIAGLLESKDTHELKEVPGLGRMPVFGRLFRTPTTSAENRELIIAVTPELFSEQTITGERLLAIERALAHTTVTPSVDDPRLVYALRVQERIASALQYPQDAKAHGMKGTVVLRLHLLPDGALQRATITQSSGISALDDAAIRAAKSQSPYGMFPAQLIERELWLELPVEFQP